jgi:hypothetical protein
VAQLQQQHELAAQNAALQLEMQAFKENYQRKAAMTEFKRVNNGNPMVGEVGDGGSSTAGALGEQQRANAQLNVQLRTAQVQLMQEREANAAHRRKLSRYDALLAKLKMREVGGDEGGGAIEAHEQTPAEDPPAKSSGSSMHQHLA